MAVNYIFMIILHSLVVDILKHVFFFFFFLCEACFLNVIKSGLHGAVLFHCSAIKFDLGSGLNLL